MKDLELDEVKKYRHLVKEMNEKESLLKEKKAEFEASVSNLKAEMSELEEEITVVEESLEEQAISLFEETKNKKYLGGIGVQERNVVEYDEDKAFEFAKEKKMFLKFDKKGFEKAAPSLGLDWITEKKVPKATFPKEIKLEE